MIFKLFMRDLYLDSPSELVQITLNKLHILYMTFFEIVMKIKKFLKNHVEQNRYLGGISI